MVSQDKHQVEKNRHLIQAMRHALDGIATMFKEERNMRYHFLTAVLAMLIGGLLRIGLSDWLWLLLAIFLVFAAEFLNTVTEAVTDLLVNHHYNVEVKKAKDVAAGGVLLAACFAVLVGVLVFGPYLLRLLN